MASVLTSVAMASIQTSVVLQQEGDPNTPNIKMETVAVSTHIHWLVLMLGESRDQTQS